MYDPQVVFWLITFAFCVGYLVGYLVSKEK